MTLLMISKKLKSPSSFLVISGTLTGKQMGDIRSLTNSHSMQIIGYLRNLSDTKF